MLDGAASRKEEAYAGAGLRRLEASCMGKEVLEVEVLEVGLAAPPQRQRAVYYMAVRLRPHCA